jgi:hypothetical protein
LWVFDGSSITIFLGCPGFLPKRHALASSKDVKGSPALMSW